VFQVRKKDSGLILAMKCMRKDCVMKVFDTDRSVGILKIKNVNHVCGRIISEGPKMSDTFSQASAILTL
jgi:hypothetical protein